MEELHLLFNMIFEQVQTAFSLQVLNFPFTYWDLIIGVFVVNISLVIISHLFGGVVGREEGGNSKNVVVSDDRRDDEF